MAAGAVGTLLLSMGIVTAAPAAALGVPASGVRQAIVDCQGTTTTRQIQVNSEVSEYRYQHWQDPAGGPGGSDTPVYYKGPGARASATTIRVTVCKPSSGGASYVVPESGVFVDQITHHDLSVAYAGGESATMEPLSGHVSGYGLDLVGISRSAVSFDVVKCLPEPRPLSDFDSVGAKGILSIASAIAPRARGVSQGVVTAFRVGTVLAKLALPSTPPGTYECASMDTVSIPIESSGNATRHVSAWTTSEQAVPCLPGRITCSVRTRNEVTVSATVLAPTVECVGTASTEVIEVESEVSEFGYQSWQDSAGGPGGSDSPVYYKGPGARASATSLTITVCKPSSGGGAYILPNSGVTVNDIAHHDLSVTYPGGDTPFTVTPRSGQSRGYGAFFRGITNTGISFDVLKCLPAPRSLAEFGLEALHGALSIAAVFPNAGVPIRVGAILTGINLPSAPSGTFRCARIDTVSIPIDISGGALRLTRLTRQAVGWTTSEQAVPCLAGRTKCTVRTRNEVTLSAAVVTPNRSGGGTSGSGQPSTPSTPQVGISDRPSFQVPLACGETGWRAEGRAKHGTGNTAYPADINWGSGSADAGKAVVASAAGTATYQGGTYNTVKVDHGGGWTTIYRHMSGITLPLGVPTRVDMGTKLGVVSDVGATGQYHLHYEQLKNGAAVQIVLDGEAAPNFAAGAVWRLPASKNCGGGGGGGGTAVTSLLGNGSLEMGSVEYWNRIMPANIVIVNDPAKAHSGSRFLATNTTSTGSVYTDSAVTVSVGQVLQGRAWLRADAGTSTGLLCVWGLGVTASEHGCSRYSVGTTWTAVDAALGARGAHSTVRVEVYPDAGSPTVLVDDVNLTKDTLLGNGSLEMGSVEYWNRIMPANIVIGSDTAKAHSGAGFLATNTTSTGSVYTDATTSVAVGQVLQGRAWLRADAGTSKGSLCLWGLGVTANENECTRYSVGTTWTPVDVALGARGAHSTARVEVYPDAGSPTVLVDDVNLSKESLLGNGSLEVGSVAYWNRISPANIVVYTDAAKAHSGAGFLATNTASTGSVYTDATTAVSVGQVLQGTAWLRAASGTATGRLCLWGLGVTANENACTRYSVGTGWTSVDVALGARGAHSTVRLEVYPDANAPTVWIDDVSLTR